MQLHKKFKQISVSFLGLLTLSGCLEEGGLSDDETLGDDRPFAYVERDYPQMEATADINTRPRLDPRDPMQFNPGARLFVRDRIALESEESEILSGYFRGAYDVKDVSISPDGAHMVFAAHGPETSANHFTWNIYEYSFDTQDIRMVISDSQLANLAHDTNPTYSNEGRIIFSSTRQVSKGDFTQSDNREYLQDFGEPASLLHSMNRDGSDIKQLTYGTYHDIEPVAMNDGQIVFIRFGREYETLYDCTVQNIDNPDFNTHPHGGGYGHGNGGGFPSGLDEPKEWTSEDKCGGSVDSGTDGERLFVQDIFNLYRITPSGGNLHRYFGDPDEQFSDKSFIHFIDPYPAPDGNIYTVMRHIFNPVYGGDIVKINTKNFYAVGKPVSEDITGVAEVSLTPGLVNFYPNQVSPAGWYSSFASYNDKTDRVLVSWAQCNTFDGERHSACSGSSISENLSASQYGIWAVDLDKGTRLPVVKGRENALYTDIVIGVRNERAHAYEGTDLGVLVDNGFGAFHIGSVYDLDGVDKATPIGGITAMRDPLVTTPDQRSERFIRVLAKVEIPAELRDAILNDPQLNPTDGSGPILGLRPILGSGGEPLYQQLAYGTVEPDGSAMVPAPAETEFTFEVVNKYGKRVDMVVRDGFSFNYLTMHPRYMLLEEGEVRECHGCHESGADNPHGRFDIEETSSNPGAPEAGAAFPNSNPEILAERAGDSMAKALTQHQGIISSNSGNMIFEDVWADQRISSPASSISLDYRNLSTPIPVNDPACLDNWTKDCRIVINYLEHIQPMWDLCRPQLDNRSCTSCHDKADNSPQDKCPGGGGSGGDLILSGDPDPWNPSEVASYVQLFEPDYYQVNIDGVWVEVLESELAATCPDGVQGDLTVLPDPNICFTRRIMSARGAIPSARFFQLFDDDIDDDAYEVDASASGNNNQDLSFHMGALSATELRMIAEWLDAGGHYYNDPEKYTSPAP